MADIRPGVIAETERLVLRREQPGDLAVWLEHMNTPEVMGRIGGVQTPEKVAESFAKMAASHAEDELPFVFVALKTDGTLIGKCGLARIGETNAPDELKGQVQVGWSLRADCWGHGYAREAAEAMLRLAFGQFGLATVFGQTSESNAASWGLMKRLGMTRRSELDYFDPDYPPEDNPTMIWSLERTAWQHATAQAGAHA